MFKTLEKKATKKGKNIKEKNQIKTSSFEQDLENNQKRKRKNDITRLCNSWKKENKDLTKKQKKKGIKYSKPESSEVETSETEEEIKSDEEDIPKNTHPQLSDSTEEDFEVKNKSEPEENEIKIQKEEKKKENINEETSSSNLDITLKNIAMTSLKS